MDPVTNSPMKSVKTNPPRKSRKEERERLLVWWMVLARTTKAKRLELKPRPLKTAEKYAEAMVWLCLKGGLLMEKQSGVTLLGADILSMANSDERWRLMKMGSFHSVNHRKNNGNV